MKAVFLGINAATPAEWLISLGLLIVLVPIGVGCIIAIYHAFEYFLRSVHAIIRLMRKK